MKEWSKLAIASHADCHVFMVLVILVSSRWTVNTFPVWTFQYYDQGSKSHKASAVISADSQCFLHPAMMIWPTISPRSFWAFFFWPCLEPGKGGTWKQTTSRPETPSWCTLAPLLAGASSGLRTVERAIIWLHVWVYLIYVFLQLYHSHSNVPWLPYLQALIQGPYLLFEAQTACKSHGQEQPQHQDVIWPMEEDGNPHCTWTDCFLVLKQHCTINLKLGAFSFVWQSLKSIHWKELWGSSADTLISPT